MKTAKLFSSLFLCILFGLIIIALTQDKLLTTPVPGLWGYNNLKMTELSGDINTVTEATGQMNSKKRILDFEKRLHAKLSIIEKAKKMVLSTCYNNHVTSRMISTACDSTKVYFITWGHHTKCEQIRKNPNIALCYQGLQIEGKAEIKGNPLDKENKKYTEKYKEKLLNVFNEFTSFDELVIIEINIHLILFFKMVNDESRIELIDIINKEACDFSAYKNPRISTNY